jgi:hypothetical protein
MQLAPDKPQLLFDRSERRLIARAAELDKSWPQLPETRQRSFLTALTERIDIGHNQIDIRIRPTRLASYSVRGGTASSNPPSSSGESIDSSGVRILWPKSTSKWAARRSQ